ncbi:hypothetical protein RDI58_025191 [Solanum bulbocastanum]|uniref:Uncharacterized protein n=1 Tax=Solanum bulbocastanum TaxID=147425 RepID=A0AAN8SYZ9_SOLBU
MGGWDNSDMPFRWLSCILFMHLCSRNLVMHQFLLKIS